MRRVLFIATVLTVALISQAAWAVPPAPGSGVEYGDPPRGVENGGSPAHGGAGPHSRDLATPDGVRTTRKPEVTPAGADGFLGWAHARAWNRPFNAFLVEFGAGRTRLNRPRTQGWLGGIDLVENQATYQQTNRRGTDSNIFTYDMTTGDRTRLPMNKVNTRQWEYGPSNSDPWVMFGRLMRNGRRIVFVYNQDNDTRERLARGVGFFPGQVNGEFATWFRCARRGCQVFVQNLTTGEKRRIPNPGQAQYSPAVDQDGDVYFARSGFACGRNVRLMFYDWTTNSIQGRLEKFPRGVDIFELFTYRDGASDNRVLFERSRCTRAFPTDIHEVIHDLTP